MIFDDKSAEETLHEIFYAAIKKILPDIQPGDIHTSHRDVIPDRMELDSAFQAAIFFGKKSSPGRSVTCDLDIEPNFDAMERIRAAAEAVTGIHTSYSQTDFTVHGPLDFVADRIEDRAELFIQLVAGEPA